MSDLRDKYFATLKIDKTDTVKRRRALNRAYVLRTFEIEHYWKRATYFWGFQIAIFAAFGLLWQTQAGNTWGLITLALAVLGALTAVANLLSASGSKFWQENWERHIVMLEDDLEGRLHKTVWLSKGKVSFSVSRINRALAHIIIAFWLLVTVCVIYKFADPPSLDLDYFHMPSKWWTFVTTSVITGAFIAFGCGWLRCQTTQLACTIPKQDGKHGDVIERCSCWDRLISRDQLFVRRCAPDEPNKDDE